MMRQEADLLGARSGRMFMGTLDDSVARYPWPGVQADLTTLNYTLLFHALLGPPVCCRIGNLLYTAPYFDAILDPERSLLLPLAKVGFFQIHMRSDTINETVQSRLNEGTNSTRAWNARVQWEKDSGLRARLHAFDTELKPGIGKLRYSPNFRAEFGRMMDLLAGGVNPSFNLVYSEWKRRFDTALTRSNFENLAIEMFDRDINSIREAMSIVNSANHYAYGQGMRGLVNEPYIDTKELSHLSGYTVGLFGDDDRAVESDAVEHLFDSGILKAIEENLFVPAVLVTEPSLWPAFASLLGGGDGQFGTHGRFAHKKDTVLHAIAEIVNGRSDYDSRKRLAEACRDLSSFVVASLNLKDERRAWVKYKLKAEAGFDIAASDTASDGLKRVAENTLKAAAVGVSASGGFAISILASWTIEALKPYVVRNVDRFFVNRLPKSLANRSDFSRKRYPIINALSMRRVSEI